MIGIGGGLLISWLTYFIMHVHNNLQPLLHLNNLLPYFLLLLVITDRDLYSRSHLLLHSRNSALHISTHPIINKCGCSLCSWLQKCSTRFFVFSLPLSAAAGWLAQRERAEREWCRCTQHLFLSQEHNVPLHFTRNYIYSRAASAPVVHVNISKREHDALSLSHRSLRGQCE
jgi:hypothetical protein